MKLSQKIDEVHPLLVLYLVDNPVVEQLCYIKGFVNLRIVTIVDFKFKKLFSYCFAIDFDLIRLE